MDPVSCTCKNGKYLASITDDSITTCDEIINGTVSANFNEKTNRNMQNFYILLKFSLITIELLIAVSIYCYLIKYQAKKHLLPFHISNNKLKQVIY